MGRYVVVVLFEAEPGHASELEAALLQQAESSLTREPGCHQFDVARAPGESASFLLYEVYENEAAFQAHLETPHFAAFDARVAPWVAAKQVTTYDLIACPRKA